MWSFHFRPRYTLYMYPSTALSFWHRYKYHHSLPLQTLKTHSFFITLLVLIVVVGTIPNSATKVLLFFDICKYFCIFLHFFCIFLHKSDINRMLTHPYFHHSTILAKSLPPSSPNPAHTMRGVNPCGAPLGGTARRIIIRKCKKTLKNEKKSLSLLHI